MKYCPNCGKEVMENSNFCNGCGKNLVENSSVAINNVQTNTSNTNGVAIAGFVVSLVSVLCCGGTSFIGLILSIIGLVQSKKKEGNGKGLAIAGIIISAILLILLILLYVFVFSAAIIDEINSPTTPGYYY